MTRTIKTLALATLAAATLAPVTASANTATARGWCGYSRTVPANTVATWNYLLDLYCDQLQPAKVPNTSSRY